MADDTIRIESIALLLEAGCDVDARNGRGSTALNLACLKVFTQQSGISARQTRNLPLFLAQFRWGTEGMFWLGR